MRKPNFFIIGAPKCGTTSLANWLGECPDIFMSKLKEPNYFNTDVRVPNRLTQRQYDSLFVKATDRHVAVGEASALYMRSVDAVPNILRYAPTAKFIVCVRNPVEMCISLHKQKLKEGIEQERSFEVAWDLQTQRANGSRTSRIWGDVNDVLYGPVCRIGTQLQRIIAIASHDRVLVINLDDMRAKPHAVYHQVLNFLQIHSNFVPKFKRYNEQLILPRYISRCLLYARIIKARLHVVQPLRAELFLRIIFERLNGILRRSSVGDPSNLFIERNLYPYFASEIDILERILEQDLSTWREPQPAKSVRRTAP